VPVYYRALEWVKKTLTGSANGILASNKTPADDMALPITHSDSTTQSPPESPQPRDPTPPPSPTSVSSKDNYFARLRPSHTYKYSVFWKGCSGMVH